MYFRLRRGYSEVTMRLAPTPANSSHSLSCSWNSPDFGGEAGMAPDVISVPDWVEDGERSLTEFAEFYKLADRVESGLLNALLMLQSALHTLKPVPDGAVVAETEPWDEPWREIGEDYRRLCGLLMGGKAFSRLDVLEQTRMRMRLDA